MILSQIRVLDIFTFSVTNQNSAFCFVSSFFSFVFIGLFGIFLKKMCSFLMSLFKFWRQCLLTPLFFFKSSVIFCLFLQHVCHSFLLIYSSSVILLNSSFFHCFYDEDNHNFCYIYFFIFLTYVLLF